MDAKNYILNQAVAEKKMHRMALEIIENNPDEKEIVLVGIVGGGSIVARNIQQMIARYSPVHTTLLSVSLDKRLPREVTLSEKADLDNKAIILIDDVANSGKTLLYALKPFLDYHPRKVQTLVLVGRSHNSFPVYPDYVGLTLATTLQEHIYVEVEGEIIKGAYLK